MRPESSESDRLQAARTIARLRSALQLAILAAALALPLVALLREGRDALGFALTVWALLLLVTAAALGLRWRWDHRVDSLAQERGWEWAVPATMPASTLTALGLASLPARARVPGVLGGSATELRWVPVLGNAQRVGEWTTPLAAVEDVVHLRVPSAGIGDELALVVGFTQPARREIHLRLRRPQRSLETLQASPLASRLYAAAL